MTREEKQKAIDALKISAPVMAVTQEEFNDYIQTLNYIMDWLEQEPKTGYWIEIAKYSDGRHEIECSECGSHIFDRGHANSYVVKEKYKYCPRCGCRMVEPQERSE